MIITGGIVSPECLLKHKLGHARLSRRHSRPLCAY